MSKKILMGLAPLLAVAAFSVMPAMASAATTYGVCEAGGVEEHPPCPEGEKAFTAFAASTEVISQKAVNSGNFILKAAAGTIECVGVVDSGTDKNTGGFGESTDKIIFNHCSFVANGCLVQTAGAGRGVIVANVTNKVKALEEVEIILPTGGVVIVFSGPPPGTCPAFGTAVGTVTGTVVGKQAATTNILIFNKTAGLLFNGAATELTGETETYTKITGKPVVI